MSETSLPTSQSSARPAPRVPTSHGYQGRAGGNQGAPLEGPEPPGSLTWRARGRSTFERLRRGATARSGPLTVTWAEGPAGDPPALAFAIGKKVGNAVVRNRLRRRLREAARRLEVLPAGLYLVRAKPAAAVLSFQEISDHLQQAVSLLASRQNRTGLVRPSAGRQTEQDGM
jgi:ribonuclease P protein component